MKKILIAGKVLAMLSLAGATAFVANAQTAGSGGGSAAVSGVGVAGPGVTVVPGQAVNDSGFLQFNNLVVQSVSGSEITAVNQVIYPMMSANSGPQPMMGAVQSATTQTFGTCYRFGSAGATKGTAVSCPVPPSSSSNVSSPATAAPSAPAAGTSPSFMPPPMPVQLYRIEVDASTQLYLRDRTPASLTSFSSGDQINVFGYYNTDGTIQAYQVRDLSKPVENQTMQLNDVTLISISGGTIPAKLTVAQNGGPCYGFTGGARQAIACPMGMMSTNTNTNAAQGMMPAYLSRIYTVIVDASTIVLNSNRTKLQLSNLKIGDSLNIYGDTSDNGQTISADIVRDLSLPATASSYSGTVTQVNGDGSFVIQTNEGQTITVQSPIQVGANVQITGVLDRLQNVLSQVANILIGSSGGGILIKPTPAPTPVPMGGPGMMLPRGVTSTPASGTPNIY